MNMNVPIVPSFFAHILNALFLVVAVYLVYIHYSQLSKADPWKLVVLVLLFGIIVGVHGISHLGLEQTYGFGR
jgi:hypothetical protein